MTPRRRVTDHPHGHEMVQLSLDNLRARFPIACSARNVQPSAMGYRCGCGSVAVVVANVGRSICFPCAEVLLEPAAETTRTRSEHTGSRS